jgi:hypothetical protein
MSETVTAVEASTAGALEDVAVTVQSAASLGAENNPLLALIVPQVVDHVAGVFAVNCCVPNANTLGLAGLIAIPALTVTPVEAVLPPPSVAVAFTVHDSAVDGAV